MQREIIETSDGSKTIRILDLDENYHSHHGALQEANHVFLANGLSYFNKLEGISIFEMGFGTGLNAFITAVEAEKKKMKIKYTGIEAFPVNSEEIKALGYDGLLGNNYKAIFQKIHDTKWGVFEDVNSSFSLCKIHERLENVTLESHSFDLIYYDAFGPRAQDEMWTVNLFQKMYDSLKKGGILVTYCAKGQVKRNLKQVGFKIEALPGPPGKREMTRALKLD